MPVYDPSTARCVVLTYKEGLLSAVGHDVKLEVRQFRVVAEADGVHGVFEAGSVASVCAMRDGRDNPGALSDKDRATIDGYVREDVLHARRYPRIEFRSAEIEPEDDGWWVEGDLTLHGRTRRIRVRVEPDGDELRARVRLNQPDFGITPFKAMLGALRIQPQVDVELRVPKAALG